MDSHTIESRYDGGMRFTASAGQHEVITDAGVADGGLDDAPGPKKLMLVSLAGCTGVDIVSILNKMKVQFDDLVIRVAAELSDNHPRIYNKVTVSYSIRLAERDKPKMEKAVLLSQEKYCGVSAMFKMFAELTHTIHYPE